MQWSDEQLEELETYLDGELPRDAVVSLERRIAADRALSQMLQTLRADRADRVLAFAMMEPANGSANRSASRLMTSVRKAATREQLWGDRYRIIRQVSAAAACILVGLSVGWLARGRGVSNVGTASIAPGIVQPTSPVAVNLPQISMPQSVVSHPSDNPNVTLVSDGTSSRIVPRATGFSVSITDDLGRVLGVQHFNSLIEAQQFSNDLGKWQTKQRELRNSSVKLVGDEF